MLKDTMEAPDAGTLAVADTARACSVAGCPGRYLARGYCIKHYYQVKRHGEVRVGSGPSPARRTCKEEGAVRHARQGWRTASSAGARRAAPAFREEHRCRDGACAEAPFSQGLCRLHYIMARYQDLVS